LYQQRLIWKGRQQNSASARPRSCIYHIFNASDDANTQHDCTRTYCLRLRNVFCSYMCLSCRILALAWPACGVPVRLTGSRAFSLPITTRVVSRILWRLIVIAPRLPLPALSVAHISYHPTMSCAFFTTHPINVSACSVLATWLCPKSPLVMPCTPSSASPRHALSISSYARDALGCTSDPCFTTCSIPDKETQNLPP
jgi:hypothetical protein